MAEISISSLLELEGEAQKQALKSLHEKDFRSALQDFILEFQKEEETKFPVSSYFKVLSLLKAYHFLISEKEPTSIQSIPLSNLLEDCLFALELFFPVSFLFSSTMPVILQQNGKNTLFLLLELLTFLAEESLSGAVFVSLSKKEKGVLLKLESCLSLSTADFLKKQKQKGHLFYDLQNFLKSTFGLFLYLDCGYSQKIFCYFPDALESACNESFYPDIFTLLQNRFSPFYIALYGERK